MNKDQKQDPSVRSELQTRADSPDHKKKTGKENKLTDDDLKGKKVDRDPEDEKDEPLERDYK